MMASRTLGAPQDTLATDREEALNAVAVSLYNKMHVGGAPISMDEARALAEEQMGTFHPPAPESENPAASILSSSVGAAAAIDPSLREQPVQDPPDKFALQRSSYNAHRGRVARMAQQAGVSADEAEQMLKSGYAEHGLAMTPNGRGGISLQGPGGAPTAAEMREAMAPLTNMAIDRRIADENARKEAWRAKTMLAGSNPATNAVNLYNTLPDEWKYVVAAGRLTPHLSQTGVTPFARDAMAANGNDRIRMLQMQIAADNARGDRQLQQQMMQFQAARDDSSTAREERSRQFEAEQAARLEAIRQQGQRAADDLQLNRERLDADRADRRDRNSTELRVAEMTAKPSLEAQMNAARAQSQEQARTASMTTNPGLHALMTGNFNNPDAAQILSDLAKSSDDSWLGQGFPDSSVARMDDALLSIAERAAAMGISNSPLLDPNVRARLINQHGRASGWYGGQGGWFGNSPVMAGALRQGG